MLTQFNVFFNQEDFIPHGHCYLWMPEVLWLHLISDAIIALAYMSIAIGLIYFVKHRTDLAYKSAFAMFGLFIMLCGFTHALNILTIWTPIYWAEGMLKAGTAFASIVTAGVLWLLIPKALALPNLGVLLALSREVKAGLRRDITAGQEIQTGLRRNITEGKLIEKVLFTEKERLRVTLGCIADAVITTDIAGNVTYLNPVAETMTGWASKEASGLPLPEVFSIINSQTMEVAPNPVERVLLEKRPMGLALHTLLVQRSGMTFPIEDSAAPILDQHGEIVGTVLVFHDVTHAEKMAMQMTHQASHDALTGLINRREFERRLDHALVTAKVDAKQHTLLYLDLDQFKIVNDTCGHMAGDELLRQLTSVLQAKVRRNDTLARLGGDEFGVLLESCTTVPAVNVAEMLLKTVHEFRFVCKEKVFQLGLSIGLVTFSDGKETLADILRMADAACYLAKDKGRNRVQIYTPEDAALAQRSREMGWVVRIQKALEENRFVLYSQKILRLNSLEDGDHYELLLRMQDEDGTLIPPMAFIPAAERYGLMPQLDRWVITTAFAQYEGRHPAGTSVGTCAINLSGASICDENFYEFVTEQFDLYKVPPGGICFEITETSAISNLTQAVVLMGKLKEQGCRFSLDDFGSGMSSFTYLKRLPVDYLKIDGEFVKDMMDDPIDQAMVEAINSIGHVMNIKTIAEFVENDAILGALERIGVDYAQGYGIEKPRLSWL
ncbi:EAL domain-containing protein [Nitrosospira sp. Is2]|uniref:EAL domain-containing protein n=1 Tax=Nitrosospira sp. Is2 TaxID=3080532 RepID=UPI00295525D1|nr:EAL domain-containing protein [Nitrosospira sp. Is2]WON72758.1 EAL domain-containing protein [Nitrosospira sp. Is2]